MKNSDKRQRILSAAKKLFNARGYKDVTLDEICSELNMSKKTFYKVFSSKQELAEQVLMESMERIAARSDRVMDSDLDPVSKLRQKLGQVKDELVQINPLFLQDVQKFAPKLWEKIEVYRKARILAMENLIRDGQNLGVIKKIDPRLALLVYLGMVKEVLQPHLMATHGLTMAEVFDAVFSVFLGGICESGAA